MSKAKIVITLEPGTIAQVRAQVRSRQSPSVSAYIASAVSARLESESMARLVADISECTVVLLCIERGDEKTPVVEVLPLSEAQARAAGVLCGLSSTSDIVDASVVI